MEFYRSSVCLFIIVVCMMGIPTHAQTGTAATETTLAMETTPAGTAATWTDAPTMETGTASSTTAVGTNAPATTGADAPTETPGTDASTEKPGTGEPTDKSGTGEPTEQSGTGEPTEKSGTGEPTEKSGTGEPTEKPATKAPTEKPGTKPPGKEFAGDLPITQIDGTDAVFGGDYEKPDSKPYKDLSVQVCTAVTAAMENSTAGSSIEGCSVSGFRSGSIVATFLLEFPADTKVTPEEVTSTLKNAFENSTDPRIAFLTVDTSSISVKEVIPSTLPPEPGLSPGAIAGIVVGSVAAVAIIVVIIVVLVMKNKGSAKVEDVEEQELTRPSSRGKSPPPDRVSNASDKSS